MLLVLFSILFMSVTSRSWMASALTWRWSLCWWLRVNFLITSTTSFISKFMLRLLFLISQGAFTMFHSAGTGKNKALFLNLWLFNNYFFLYSRNPEFFRTKLVWGFVCKWEVCFALIRVSFYTIANTFSSVTLSCI